MWKLTQVQKACSFVLLLLTLMIGIDQIKKDSICGTWRIDSDSLKRSQNIQSGILKFNCSQGNVDLECGRISTRPEICGIPLAKSIRNKAKNQCSRIKCEGYNFLDYDNLYDYSNYKIDENELFIEIDNNETIKFNRVETNKDINTYINYF